MNQKHLSWDYPPFAKGSQRNDWILEKYPRGFMLSLRCRRVAGVPYCSQKKRQRRSRTDKNSQQSLAGRGDFWGCVYKFCAPANACSGPHQIHCSSLGGRSPPPHCSHLCTSLPRELGHLLASHSAPHSERSNLLSLKGFLNTTLKGIDFFKRGHLGRKRR